MTLRRGESPIGKHLEALIPRQTIAIESDVVDSLAVLVEMLADDRPAADRLHDLKGEPVVRRETYLEAEFLRLAPRMF